MATNDTSPLSPATFHVLLSLAAKDLHGYGIILEISRISNGEYRPGPGTLYDNLAKLLNLGWVEDYEQKARAGQGPHDVLGAPCRVMELLYHISTSVLQPPPSNTLPEYKDASLHSM